MAPRRFVTAFDRHTTVIDFDVGFTSLELPEESEGCLPVRGESVWYALPPGDEGQVLTAHGPGPLTWEDAPEGGGEGGPDFDEEVTAPSFKTTPTSGEGAVHGPTGQGLSLYSDTYVRLRGGAGTTEYTAGVLIDLQRTDGQSIFFLRRGDGNIIFRLPDTGVLFCQGMQITLVSGRDFDVYNGSGQRIFQVTQSGDVKCAGTLTESLGAGF